MRRKNNNKTVMKKGFVAAICCVCNKNPKMHILGNLYYQMLIWN